jgi:hypothetical protein
MVIEILQNKDALPTDPEERKKESERRKQVKAERRARGEAEEPGGPPFRGGVTLIIGMEGDDFVARYAIYKRIDSAEREARQREFQLRAAGDGGPDAAEYSSDGLPAGWLSNEALRKKWFKNRVSNLEDMRASSCACRRLRMEGKEKKDADKAAKKAGIPVPNALTEPFALLHQG